MQKNIQRMLRRLLFPSVIGVAVQMEWQAHHQFRQYPHTGVHRRQLHGRSLIYSFPRKKLYALPAVRFVGASLLLKNPINNLLNNPIFPLFFPKIFVANLWTIYKINWLSSILWYVLINISLRPLRKRMHTWGRFVLRRTYMSDKEFKTIDEQLEILLHNNYYRISGHSPTLRRKHACTMKHIWSTLLVT